ncbi:hypothetical protein BDY21DRAFT_385925 [Lineolata rhizophorae]|uniref:Uncharacterized protein n=1 Tax=Lineolata rhizophorae TaxID=578093 RepID=A0A6A6NZ68_9PEZI|nr:hypothetical protein BDY21DRAFT_385925 [Lineolata rhizophorae]
MIDGVRPDPESIQQILQRSRSLWFSYAAQAWDSQLPPQCAQLRSVLGQIPAFPARFLPINTASSILQYNQSRSGLQISGCNLPPKEMRHELLCGVHRSIVCSFTERSCFTIWPGVHEGDSLVTMGNHLAILMLAWAYILSARWIELQVPHDPRTGSPHPGGMRYSDPRAPLLEDKENVSSDAIEADIGETCKKAARWWAAILAPDQTFLSPWSAHLDPSRRLNLRWSSTLGIAGTRQLHQPPETTPSSEEALGHLLDYCEYHRITNQCIPALAATLFFPWKNGDGGTTRRALQEEALLLPRYMTLSCNIWGLRALLSGVFFDPTVPCNLVSPWMQPAFKIIDPLIAAGESTRLATIMAKREPILAALWLGAIIIGMENTIVRPLRTGLFAVELHSAAWTGTLHSFVTLRNTPRTLGNEVISRSDECRLLYLTGSEGHSRVPVCPWPPFGATPLAFADLEKEIFAHEWFDVGSASEESILSNDSSPGDQKGTISEWLDMVDEAGM